MRTKDFIFFSCLAAVILALTFPAWLSASSLLANFGDLHAYHYPLRHLAVGGLQEGRLPFWNPYIFCGLPLSANPQSVLFYPVAVLGAVLPLSLALSWDCVLHLLWGGLGMILLARREGLSSWAAAFLAGLFALSPFLLYRISAGIPTLLASLAWAPWCWLAMLSGAPSLLAGVWALQFLSGHPQFQLINGVGMAAWAATHPRRRELLGRLARAGLGAAALALIQWPQTWRFLSLSVRRHWPGEFAAAYALAPRDLLTWLHPGLLGEPLSGTYGGPPSVFFETCGVFLGWAGLAAAAVGLARGAWRAAFLIALGALLALGRNSPLAGLGMDAGLLRTPARWLLLSLWGMLVAAGCAVRGGRTPGALAFRAFLVVAAALQLGRWAQGFIRVEDSSRYLAANPVFARAVGGRPLRVQTDPALPNPDKTMLYRAMNVNGYDAFYLAGYPAFAARSEGRPAADASRTYLSRPDTPAMRSAAVAYRLDVSGRLEEQKGARGLAYFAEGERALEGGRLEVVSDRPERWRVRGPRPAGADRVVVSIPAYPGWSARLDGRPVGLEPWGFFQAVRLPRAVGSLDLRVDFRPPWWTAWVLAAAAAWLVWLAGLPLVWRRGAR